MPPTDQLVVTSPRGAQRIYFLRPGTLTLGRSSENDIVLRDPKVSRLHARLEVDDDGCRLIDEESRHGTYVDGKKQSEATIATGVRVQLGDYLLELRDQAPSVISETVDTLVDEDEYIEVVAGKEPEVVESVSAGEVTMTDPGVEHSINDLTVARLVVHSPGSTREVKIPGDELTIGRQSGCDLILDDGLASGRHAVIARRNGSFELRDEGSKNGTWIGDRRIERELLISGTNIRVGGTNLVFKAPLSRADLSIAEDDRSKRRPVVVIPGIMGSELWRGDEMIWPDIVKCARNPDLLALPDQGLEARSIARQVIAIPHVVKLEAYSSLTDFLNNDLGYTPGEDLLEFAYDWRRDNRDSARKLKEAIDEWRANVLGAETKITIIAHSMGSLVARYYLQCLGGADAVERLVLMGAPCFGSPHIVQGLLFGPKILPLGIANEAYHRVILSLPSCYQLIPVYKCAFDADGNGIDLHADDSWIDPERRPILADAREFHREIGDSVSVPLTCIFGWGVKTTTRMRVKERGSGGWWQRARFILQRAGDNRVAEKWAFLKGADLHPVKQYHGALWTDEDVQMRLKLELLS